MKLPVRERIDDLVWTVAGGIVTSFVVALPFTLWRWFRPNEAPTVGQVVPYVVLFAAGGVFLHIVRNGNGARQIASTQALTPMVDKKVSPVTASKSSFDWTKIRFSMASIDLSGLNVKNSINESVIIWFTLLNFSGAQIELAGGSITGRIILDDDELRDSPSLETSSPVGEGASMGVQIRQACPDLRNQMASKGMTGGANDVLLPFDLTKLRLQCRTLLPGNATVEADIQFSGDMAFDLRSPFLDDRDNVALSKPILWFGSPRHYDSRGWPMS